MMISMIIVDYKSMDRTMQYIKDCIQNIEGLEHFVIVDNAANEEFPPKLLTIRGKEVYTVSAGENSGFAKGNNLGAATARDIWDDKYYIFSNNDLRFNRTFSVASFLKPFDENDKVAVVGPKLIGLRGDNQNPLPEQNWKRMLFVHFLSLLPPKIMKRDGGISEPNSGITTAVIGAFMCVKATDFWNVGGFDENTFLFMEELILAKRLERVNKCMFYNNSEEIIHEHGATVKKTAGIIRSLKADFDSRYYYAKEYCNAGKGWLFLSKINFAVVITLFRIKKAIKEKTIDT